MFNGIAESKACKTVAKTESVITDMCYGVRYDKGAFEAHPVYALFSLVTIENSAVVSGTAECIIADTFKTIVQSESCKVASSEERIITDASQR